jgi:hypothetical protein
MIKSNIANSLFVSVLSLYSLCFISVAHAQPILPEIDPPPSATPPVALPPVVTPPTIEPPKSIPSTSIPPKSEPALSTLISCKNSAGAFTTVAEQGENKAVLFTWKTTEFGPEFTPESRCQIVSSKFNSFLQENGGAFSGILLTTGVVNGYPVICMNKSDDSACRVLFTLKKKNRNQANNIINTLKDPNNIGASGINESSSDIVKAPVVDLGEWSKRKLSGGKFSAPSAVRKPILRNGGGFR